MLGGDWPPSMVKPQKERQMLLKETQIPLIVTLVDSSPDSEVASVAEYALENAWQGPPYF